MLRQIFSLAAGSLLLAGCAYVGEPLPPSLGVPRRVEDLSVVQRGGALVVRFTAPELTTDGVVLKRVERVELRAGPVGGQPFDIERWAAQARSIDNRVTAPGPAEIEIAAREWVGQEVIVAVRAWGRKGRPAEWSRPLAFRVVAPLARPAALKAEAAPEGVRLSWEGPRGAAFRVLRGDVEVAIAEAPRWVDATAQYGKACQYAVQAFLKSGDSLAESEMSETVSITPEDRFPPAAPAGLSAVATVRSIELSWERSTEADLKGYRLYRSAEGGAWERIGELLEVPAASDRALEAGRRYRYAVTAVDQKGNESPRSPPVEIAAP